MNDEKRSAAGRAAEGQVDAIISAAFSLEAPAAQVTDLAVEWGDSSSSSRSPTESRGGCRCTTILLERVVTSQSQTPWHLGLEGAPRERGGGEAQDGTCRTGIIHLVSSSAPRR